MAKYRLNIQFTEKDLQTIYNTGEKVIIVKHTNENLDNQVAWVSFCPFMYNTIEWENVFSIYASTSELKDGIIIHKLSSKSASTRISYNFKQGIFQHAMPQVSLTDNTYAVRNSMDMYTHLTFGLAQNSIINGYIADNHPINAVKVPYGQIVTMTPIEKIDVYLGKDIDDGTIISHIRSVSLPVEYGDLIKECTIAYNGITGRFYPID